MFDRSPKTLFLTSLLVLVATVAFFRYRAPTESPQAAELPQLGPSPLEVSGLGPVPYERRFLAAGELARSEAADFDERLELTLENGGLSEDARGDLEFVQWRRSGDLSLETPPLPSKRPNVLMISIDTLRADHLGCYGYERDTSPEIDALASRGVVFENAFSTAPWTLPGHMSMFTSMYPSFHKSEWRGGGRLNSAIETMPKSLRALGYRTAAFVTHPYLSKQWGFATGFDLYFRHPRVVRADTQTDSVIEWIDWHMFQSARGATPSEFFLFVHYMDPHETYDAPEPHAGRYTRGYRGSLKSDDHLVTMFFEDDFESETDFAYTVGLYDEEIHYVDQAVGRLLRHLEHRDLLDSTIVVLTSDHGEEFKDHGAMGHQTTLYREQLQVPLVLVSPTQLPRGARVRTQASVVDIFPTIVGGLLGEELPRNLQGTDLTDALVKGGKTRSNTPRYAELGPMGQDWVRGFHKKAILTDRYKLIVDLDENKTMLFDLRSDPSEQTDLYPKLRRRPDVRRLQSRLATFMQEGAAFDPSGEDQPVELDPTSREQLRALGYLE